MSGIVYGYKIDRPKYEELSKGTKRKLDKSGFSHCINDDLESEPDQGNAGGFLIGTAPAILGKVIKKELDPRTRISPRQLELRVTQKQKVVRELKSLLGKDSSILTGLPEYYVI